MFAGRTRESAETVLLVVLVLSSLVLSGYIWLGTAFKSLPEQDGTSLQSVSISEMTDLVIPPRLLVHLGAGRHAALSVDQSYFEALWWTMVDKVFVQANKPDKVAYLEWTGEDEFAAAAKVHRGLEADLPRGIPYRVWQIIFDIKLRYKEVDEVASLQEIFGLDIKPPPIERIGVFFTPDGLLLFFGRDGDYLQARMSYGSFESGENERHASLEQIDAIFAQLGRAYDKGEIPGRRRLTSTESYGVKGTVYVPSTPPELGVIVLEEKERDPEQLEQSFFAGASPVERGKEPDGTTFLHTQGKFLRFYPTGAIEYRNRSPDPESSQVDALLGLRVATEFVKQHHGSVQNLKIWRMTNIYKRGTLSFKEGSRVSSGLRVDYASYYQGRPFLGPHFSVSAVMGRRRILSYSDVSRIPAHSMLRMNVIKAEEAVVKAVEYVRARGKAESPLEVTDVQLGYYNAPPDEHQAVAFPVWRVTVNDAHQIYVQAHNGPVIFASWGD